MGSPYERGGERVGIEGTSCDEIPPLREQELWEALEAKVPLPLAQWRGLMAVRVQQSVGEVTWPVLCEGGTLFI